MTDPHWQRIEAAGGLTDIGFGHPDPWPHGSLSDKGEPRMVIGADTLDADFARIGEDFAAAGHERRGPVGTGVGRLCSQRAIVDFGVAWMERHRPASLAD